MTAKILYKKPEALRDVPTHYCPGCGHGIAHRLVAEVIDELGIRERTVGIAPVGCAVLAYDYFNFDVTEAAHGRPPAVATGMKRVRPELIIFTYQGDGDLAAIGTAEIIHAANRGENITVIFVNNGIYGMTGGQMAPTTLLEQKTATSPVGRSFQNEGPPLKVCEMLAPLDGTAFIARGALDKPANIIKARGYIRKAFQNQMDNRRFSLVEILSPCPTYWHLSPRESLKRLTNEVIPHFPLGIIKDE
ncbi:MAG: thiamine pyrophosphate-dependent enzyme [Candidatus Auribacterota bacterium]|nr:thiamine pyrophosphate-dependent enzyme [Candidatus Auribacterota bacterium]